MSEDNPPFAEVIGCELDGDHISRNDTDEVDLHLSREVTEHFVIRRIVGVIQANQEGCIGETFFHHSRNLNDLFCHKAICRLSNRKALGLYTGSLGDAREFYIPFYF